MTIRRRTLATTASVLALCLGAPAMALAAPESTEAVQEYQIAAQPLRAALIEFSRQSRSPVVASTALVRGLNAQAVEGSMNEAQALDALLAGTGLVASFAADGGWSISRRAAADPQGGSAGGDVDALIVTAQKREENIQDVPIAISAFSQEDLTRSQVAGGPDLMTQVPNFTFTKTNFSSYSIQIRGIGTQAISATTDAAVAVAMNNTPFIRNRFFEQEFYDLQRVEVLRGPQGTLYGRNATAGVVNIITAKPSFRYEAKLSGDVSNYNSTRVEGMVNVPLADDKVALRVAGAWTKRDGYVTNEITGNPIDGRDLWSTRVSLRFAPTDAVDVNLIWEHFKEDDDRLRSGKQLCHKDIVPSVGGVAIPNTFNHLNSLQGNFSQGCKPASLYSPDSFETPNGYALPYYQPLSIVYLPTVQGLDPYLSTTQSRDLRVIESTVDPHYTAETDVVELQFSVDLSDELTLTSETGYLSDTLFSTQDYNRFNTAPGAFDQTSPSLLLRDGILDADGFFCDPQVGCANRLVAVDLSTADSSHFSQEFRLASDYDGPFNFSLGANFLRYDTEDKYYVFINTLTMYAALIAGGDGGPPPPYVGGVSDNSDCLRQGFVLPDLAVPYGVTGCIYIDPNPIGNLDDRGHNYFLSRNPYKLISYAAFGEAYYNITDNLKITAGLRLTVDKKEAPRIPSWVLASIPNGGFVGRSASGAGYSVSEVIEQEWREPTGRLTIDWKPDLAFTDETLLYASYAHGYKAGGANPPPPGLVLYVPGLQERFPENFLAESATHPKTFAPEFVEAFEIGAKNTFLDGRLTVNTAAFYYDYEGYQISQIVDRSALNLNFDATVWGLEIEADWRPMDNFRLGFKGGYEHTRVADGERAIDLMDRTAGHADWVVLKPFPSLPSNCIMPVKAVVTTATHEVIVPGQIEGGNISGCELAYTMGVDPVTELPYVPNPTEGTGSSEFGMAGGTRWIGYEGFDPLDESQGHNRGQGFYKELGGNELPNAPHFTATITADYTLPLPNDWLATLHTDLYYQSEAWTRIFNMEGYDKLKAYTNVNVAAIFTNEEAGWMIMAYVKNVMDRDSITGAFLNSDDTGLTTNVFLTEPRLYGLRVTKEFTGGPWWTGADPDHKAGEPYPLTVELSGQVARIDAPYETLTPSFNSAFSSAIDPTVGQNRDLDWGDGRSIRLTYRPKGSVWSISGGVRYGRGNTDTSRVHQDEVAGPDACAQIRTSPYGSRVCNPDFVVPGYPAGYFYKPDLVVTPMNWSDSEARDLEERTVVDFVVGRDVGLGRLGAGKSSLALGVRYAEFGSTTTAAMEGVPDLYLPDAFIFNYSSHTRYKGSFESEREFSGAGPTITWEASVPLLGDDSAGRLDLDWSLTGGVLFGKQQTAVTGGEASRYAYTKYVFPLSYLPPLAETPVTIASRSKSISVPLLDASLGLSYEMQRIKVGAGYRWERYFDVLDAGFTERQSFDRTIDGPYFKVSIGFGG